MNMFGSVLGDAGTGSQSGNPFGSFLIPMIAISLILLYFNFTSKKKQDRDRKAQLGAMKRGDRVKTIGGILGTIVEVRDGEIVVKVDESNNTKIKFDPSAISRIITEDDKVEAKTP
jgi:preprotein translocase subunit YajC